MCSQALARGSCASLVSVDVIPGQPWASVILLVGATEQSTGTRHEDPARVPLFSVTSWGHLGVVVMGRKRTWVVGGSLPISGGGKEGKISTGEGDAGNEGDGGSKKPRTKAHMSLSGIKGHQAVVATCNVRFGSKATKELLALLNEYADKQGADDKDSGSLGAACAGGKDQVPGEGLGSSVEDLVRQEIDSLREGCGETSRFLSVDTGVKGVIAVCVMDPDIDIVPLVSSMFSDIRRTKEKKSRFLQRVTPLPKTCYAELEVLKNAARGLIASAFPSVVLTPVDMMAGEPNAEKEKEGGKDQGKRVEPEGGTDGTAGTSVQRGEEKGDRGKGVAFRVEVRKRNTALSGGDIITAVAGQVGEGHRVDIKNAEVVIAVEAVKSMVGLAVLADYAQNCEYNLHKLQDEVCGTVLHS